MEIRPATDSDRGFCFEHFTKSIRAVSTHVEGLTNPQIGDLLNNLLRKGWQMSVAETHGYLCGFVVFRLGNCLAWVYAREMFRYPATVDGENVCAALLRHAQIDPAKTIESPFCPNRGARRWKIAFRPYETVP